MRIFIIFVILLFCSCASPVPDFEKQTFIPKREVVVNSLYQEGIAQYRSGRFIDAELKMRQAIYLYPEAENLRSNLALILKSSGLYEESNQIYLDLIQRYPEAYDYKFALAESYHRQKKNQESSALFRELMYDFEKLPEISKAAHSARSLANLYFIEGYEVDSYCSSAEAFMYSADADQRVRHIRILLALGYSKQAEEMLLPLIEQPSDIKDLAILKLASLVYFGVNDIEQSKKFMTLAKENQTAGLKEFDAELEKIRQIILDKYPDEKTPEELELEKEREEQEEEELPELIFSEQSLLYWPAGLVELYYEYQQKLELAEE